MNHLLFSIGRSGCETSTRGAQCRRLRGGFTVIEATIAALLLATATIAIARYAYHSYDLDRAADTQLASQLAADNAVARLSLIPGDQWESQAASVSEAIERSSGVRLVISILPFQANDSTAGLHAMISPSSSETKNHYPNPVKPLAHLWLLSDRETSTDSAQDNADE